jgi:hypothetical protein
VQVEIIYLYIILLYYLFINKEKEEFFEEINQQKTQQAQKRLQYKLGGIF